MPVDKVQNVWCSLSALPINHRAPTGGLCVGIFTRFLKRWNCCLDQYNSDLLITQFSFPWTSSKLVIAQCTLFSSSYIQPHLSVSMCHMRGFRSLQISFISPSVVSWWTFSSRRGETWVLGSEPFTADFREVSIM